MTDNRNRMPLVGLLGMITAICGPDWPDQIEKMRTGHTVRCPDGSEIELPPFRIPEPKKDE